MAGDVLLALFVGAVALMAFVTWLDRVVIPMDDLNGLAYAAGILFAGLAFGATLALSAGW